MSTEVRVKPFTATERKNLLSQIQVLEAAGPAAGDPLIDALLGYAAAVPRVRISRCPITQEVVTHSLDTLGLDGLWWHYYAPVRPEESLPDTFYSITGAVQLSSPLEQTPFLVGPGPERPYVVPRMLQREGVVAVVSQVRIGRHDAYPVLYFAGAPTPGRRFNAWGRSSYHLGRGRAWDRLREVDEPVDYELKPWIDKGKLLWIEPGDRQLELRASARGCPYLKLKGRRRFMWMQFGEAWEQ